MLGRYIGRRRVEASKRFVNFFMVNLFHLGVFLPLGTAGYHCSICGLALGGFWFSVALANAEKLANDLED